MRARGSRTVALDDRVTVTAVCRSIDRPAVVSRARATASSAPRFSGRRHRSLPTTRRYTRSTSPPHPTSSQSRGIDRFDREFDPDNFTPASSAPFLPSFSVVGNHVRRQSRIVVDRRSFGDTEEDFSPLLGDYLLDVTFANDG